MHLTVTRISTPLKLCRPGGPIRTSRHFDVLNLYFDFETAIFFLLLYYFRTVEISLFKHLGISFESFGRNFDTMPTLF